jgi:hypothetical protein
VETEETTPEPSTIATAVLLLLHVPPPVALLSVVDEPRHKDIVPVNAAGIGLTVTVAVVEHPVEETVYVIVVVPADTPPKTPDAEPTVAIEELALVHVPPPVGLVRFDVAPTQTVVPPPIAPGSAFTVTFIVR